MKNYRIIYFFVLSAVVFLMIGCGSNAVVTNSSTNSNQAKTAEANKNSAAGGDTTKSTAPPTSSEKSAPVYTGLTDKSCKTIEKNEEEEWITQMCEGVGGYKLEVFEGDLRASINVIAPNGKKSELNFQQVSGRFSLLGEKAEWRVEKKDGKDVPTALIVRFMPSKGDDDTKSDSLLIVSKISAEKSCITDVVKASANQNEEARKLAETAPNKPCKTDF